MSAEYVSPKSGRTYGNPRHWRNRDAWKVAIGWFDGALREHANSRRSSTDFDFVAEANSLFLLIEFKRQAEITDSGEIQTGQWLAYARLAMTGLFTVYTVQYSEPGDDTKPPVIERIRRIIDDRAEPHWESCDFEQLYEVVQAWRAQVSSKPCAAKLRKLAITQQQRLLALASK